MAKSKKVDSDDVFSQLAEACGGEVLSSLQSAKYFVDTGNLAINYCCSGRFIGGGIAGGRLTEIYGPSAGSKSLIASNVLFGCQRLGGVPVLLDTENAVNHEFIKSASHCDLDKIVRMTPQTLEECFIKMYKSIKFLRSQEKYNGKPIVIVYDSISVSPCAREFRETQLPEKYTDAEYEKIVGSKEQPGERAKICSREFRKLNTIMEENDATVIVINQTRDKIGVMYGNPETTGGGGNALPFYASLRFRPQTQQKIEKKIGSKKKIIGINIKVVNKKNRFFRPFVEVDNIPLYFDRGMNPLGGLLGALLDAERVTASGAGNFVVNPAFTNGEVVKFKSSMEKNEVPLDILYSYPKLIDAPDEEYLRVYLKPYENIMNIEKDEDEIISDVANEDEEEKIGEELA